MNMRREAMVWSVAIVASILLGLIVVGGAIALSFDQADTATLNFVAAQYRQDDYSAEGQDAVHLNPLDPGLVQEAMLEDQARSSLALNNHYLEPTIGQPGETVTSPAPTSTVRPAWTNTSTPTVMSFPSTPTNTSLPSTVTNTFTPTATSLPPTATNTSLPSTVTNTSLPPAPSSTPVPPTPSSTPTQSTPTNTAKPHKPTHTPRPTHTPKPTRAP